MKGFSATQQHHIGESTHSRVARHVSAIIHEHNYMEIQMLRLLQWQLHQMVPLAGPNVLLIIIVISALTIPKTKQNFFHALILFITSQQLSHHCHICVIISGLNVYSMLKHDALVLTLPALNKIEERILYHYHKPGAIQKKFSNTDLDPL